ncbi:MAG: signal peptidase I [Deltaproteobacteria bacterium]|nr:signal peptidase I [Deltaproteobacteria bacterium]
MKASEAKANPEKVETQVVRSSAREYTEAIATAIILALIVRTFFFQAFKIPSGSMKPTLLVGDHILVNKIQYGIDVPFLNKPIVEFQRPRRGQVVVFIYPVDPSKDFIKRIIGLPGDQVRIVDKQIYINGKPYADPHAVRGDPAIKPGDRDNFGPVTVPEDCYFVMGDNRDFSYDSRFWGFVDRDALRGKAFIIYGSWTLDPPSFAWNRVLKRIH